MRSQAPAQPSPIHIKATKHAVAMALANCKAAGAMRPSRKTLRQQAGRELRDSLARLQQD